MSQVNMNNFVSLSVLLTGFQKDIIAPSLDPKDIKQVYFDLFSAFPVTMADGSIQKMDFLTPLLTEYVELKEAGLSPEAIGEKLINTENGTSATPSIALMSQSLIFTWYLGILPGIKVSNKSFVFDRFGTSTAGSEAYTTGLAWNAMQAHPMGYSNMSYGYWSKEPVDLKFYTGEEQ